MNDESETFLGSALARFKKEKTISLTISHLVRHPSAPPAHPSGSSENDKMSRENEPPARPPPGGPIGRAPEETSFRS